MTGTSSLRTRLLAGFGLFGVALLVTYGAVLPRLVLSTEDRIFQRQLARCVEAARQRFDASPAAALPLAPPVGPGVVATLECEGLDPALAGWIQALPVGVFEFNDEVRPGTPAQELFVAVEAYGEKRLQVLFDVGALEGMEGLWDGIYLTAIGLGLLVAAGAAGAGILIVRRLSRALAELEQLAVRAPLVPAAEALELPAARRQDELGRVARAWLGASDRAEQALDREKRFTRDVSHELRTPIAAARGALELVASERDAEPERVAVLCERAGNALSEMQDLVTGFLWLARESSPKQSHEPCPLEPEIHDWIAQLEPAAARAGSRFELRVAAPCAPPAPRAVLRILTGNLLRNAVAHGEAGTIEVVLEDGLLTVTNPARISPPTPGGEGAEGSFGFGLTIVADLCRRFDFELDLGAGPQGAFVASLAFGASPTPESGELDQKR